VVSKASADETFYNDYLIIAAFTLAMFAILDRPLPSFCFARHDPCIVKSLWAGVCLNTADHHRSPQITTDNQIAYF